MNIIQFLRIFWGRAAVVVIAVVCSAVGGFAVVSLVQPRYEATARVQMNLAVRPDPVTGEIMNAKTATAFFENQLGLIRDYSVTGPVVDRLGWLSDPGKIQAYAHRAPSDTRDFRRWLSEQVEQSTNATIEGAGSSLAITYRAPNAEIAKTGAETLRQAYLDASLAQRRAVASKSAEFFSKQALEARQLAEAAENAKAAFEKSTGIIMQGRESDLDSDRLAALAGQAALSTAPSSNSAAPTVTSGAMQLAQIDAQIADSSQRLGPNHPQMQALRSRRELVAGVAAQEAEQQRRIASGESGAAAIARALAAQKQRVIGQRDQVERLRQLQSEVELRRSQYQSAAARAGQFMLEASVTDAGVSPMGIVVSPSKPTFPNKPLIMGGSVALGFGMGMALALLLELLNRRVRSVDDLSLSNEIRCIGVIEEPSGNNPTRRIRRALRGLIPQWAGAPA
jgi:uncharacterized protein involved in exopolysaccharide biosynthesis